MSAVIRETDVFTDAWNTVFAKVNTLTDPGGKSKWVFSAFPDALIDKIQSYPLIVIEPISISYDPITFGTTKKGPMRVTIEVYSTKAIELDAICDDVIDKFETQEGNFLISGASVMRLISSSYAYFPRGDFRVHNKTLVYEFDYWWY